jgi:hypothetical protein
MKLLNQPTLTFVVSGVIKNNSKINSIIFCRFKLMLYYSNHKDKQDGRQRRIRRIQKRVIWYRGYNLKNNSSYYYIINNIINHNQMRKLKETTVELLWYVAILVTMTVASAVSILLF